VSLEGDFRVRLERWSDFHLGRADAPFDRFRAATDEAMPDGSCEGGCGDPPLRFATMRLRLAPTVHVTDDVSVHAMFDLFDNFVLGATPTGDPAFPERQNRVADAVSIRRAWASFRLRDLAELRVGRMPAHFGVGFVQNEANRLDDDVSTEVDRLMLRVPVGPLVAFGAWDFAARGDLGAGDTELGVPFDPSNADDAHQWTLGVVHEREGAAELLARGEVVLEGGAQLIGRDQHLSNVSDRPETWVTRGARTFTPHGWLRLRHRDLRVEVEAAGHFGRIENAQPEGFSQDDLRVRQVGVVLDAEQRLLDGRLTLRGTAIYASGDAELGQGYDAEELSAAGNTATLFRAHESFRVDEILWRRIYGRVAGAWVTRVGGRYDVYRDRRGRGVGVRADAIYSRASAGTDRDMGLELDLGLEYGTETQQGRTVFLAARWGILFPLARLRQDTESKRAQALRLVLGTRF